MKNKIGILTLPFNGNYGGLFQAAALYEYLSQKGCSVTLIKQDNSVQISAWKRCISKVLRRVPFQNIKNLRRLYLFDQYSRELMPQQTGLVRSLEQLNQIVKCEEIDTIIVGSDQVWRWEYIANRYRMYFLDLVADEPLKRISYAASFGTDHLPSEAVNEEISNLLSKFDAVSVREQSGQQLCRLLGRTDCAWVLDPTFLLSIDYYRSIMDNSVNYKGNFVFSYILDPSKDAELLVDCVREGLGIYGQVVPVGLKSNLSARQWLALFYSASFIITDSFHGVVFSIIFRKNFIVLANSSRGKERFISLLGWLGLRNRMFDSKSIASNSVFEILSKQINYEEVFEKIEEQKDRSETFLRAALGSW